MNFDDFSKQFGAKEDFVRNIAPKEQPAFKRAATKLHKAGFDWYIANDDLCFGVKPPGNSKAAPRAGRLWKTYEMAINLGRQHSSAMTPAMRAHLVSSGGTLASGGSRIFFSLAKFDALVRDAAFVKKLAELCGVSKLEGRWPGESDEPLDKGTGKSTPIPPDVERKALRQVRQRQAKFKKSLIGEWGARCCVSGCKVKSVLEAAHITPYIERWDYSMENGLLLRADIHKLFDRHLLSVDANGVVHIAPSVKDKFYSALIDRKVAFPEKEWAPKLMDTLAKRHKQYLEKRGLK